MDSKISGSWPGGPKREGPPQKRSGPPRLQRVEHMEERSAGRNLRRRRGARAKRVLAGLTFSIAIAAGFGWALGLRSHTTADELMAEQTAQRRPETGLSDDINRTLLELWRMEDVEYQRNRR